MWVGIAISSFSLLLCIWGIVKFVGWVKAQNEKAQQRWIEDSKRFIDYPPELIAISDSDSVGCADAVTQLFAESHDVWDTRSYQLQNLVSWVDSIYWYQFDSHVANLHGNPDFVQWTKRDWSQSSNYVEGADAPEWDEYTAQIWNAGASYDWPVFLDAAYSLLEWRADNGMAQFLPPYPEPVVVDRAQFEGCSAETMLYAEEMTLFMESSTNDDRLVNLEPILSDIWEWQQAEVAEWEAFQATMAEARKIASSIQTYEDQIMEAGMNIDDKDYIVMTTYPDLEGKEYVGEAAKELYDKSQ